MNNTLNNLQHLFVADNRIKNEMIRYSLPKNLTLTNEELIRFSDSLYNSVIYMYEELIKISSDFLNDSKLLEKINKKKDSFIGELKRCDDTVKLRNIYKNYVTDIDPSFISDLKNECVGYTFRYPTNSIEKASTVNELLHLIHFYVMNNNDILQSCDKVASKKNDSLKEIRLFGDKYNLGEVIFNSFPSSLDVGQTDIVSIFPNLVIMMIRDRGHALTLEIRKEDDIISVNYFIPKICSVSMVNKLPGVEKVNEDSFATVGSFQSKSEDFLINLYEFIDMVPTDLDMINERKNKK
ncbi:MAG: hypothetical protein IKG27_05435 [Bacilli bacterium]|nr:hypothetical protein [Bacilli bacterium]